MKAIIAVDDSPMSEELIQNVLRRRWPEHTQFKVLTVLEPICYPSEIEHYASSLVKVFDQRMERAAKHCEKVRERLEGGIPGASVHFDIREGSAPSQIVDAAVDWSADKILMGAHSKDVCPHNLLGSVSQRVASHSPCTIEIIRRKEGTHSAKPDSRKHKTKK